MDNLRKEFKYLILANNIRKSSKLIVKYLDLSGYKKSNHINHIRKVTSAWKQEGWDTFILSHEDAASLYKNLNRFLDVKTKDQAMFVTDSELLDLKQRCCDEFGIPDVESLHSTTRKKEYVVARQLFMTLVAYDGYYSLTETANMFNKDHSTGNHSRKVINNYIETKDKRFYQAIKNVITHYKLNKRFGI